ncbi:MAG: ATP synthase F0 subunit C [Gemmataceae bacterium]
MNKHVSRLLVLAVIVVLVSAGPALAKPSDDKGPGTFYGIGMGVGIGAAVTMIGAGLGFGRIGAAALESMARQPEVANRLFTTMLLIAALLEGATFFSLIVCLLMVLL